MNKLLIILCGLMICTIFVPHDAFAKSFTIKLFESMTLDSNDKPADKKEIKKKEAKKKEAKKDSKKKDPKKELTKSKGKKTWKKIVHPSKPKLVPE